MAASTEVRHFARAAYMVAAATDALRNYLERFELLSDTFRRERAFRHLLITRRMSVEQKMGMLNHAFGDALSHLEYGTLRLLLERRLGIHLPAVWRALERFARLEGGAALNLTVTASEFQSAEQLQALKERIALEMGRPLRMVFKTDPSLLGGIKLRLGNILIDGSMARRLALLREQLV